LKINNGELIMDNGKLKINNGELKIENWERGKRYELGGLGC